MGKLRVDRWLWFSRFYKTRTLASEAVAGGHVRVNGRRASPGARVSAGDTVRIVKDQLPYEVRIVALPQRRGPAAEARAGYEEDPEVRDERQAVRDAIRQDRLRMPRTNGRPDKHTRQHIRNFNRNPGDT